MAHGVTSVALPALAGCTMPAPALLSSGIAVFTILHSVDVFVDNHSRELCLANRRCWHG